MELPPKLDISDLTKRTHHSSLPFSRRNISSTSMMEQSITLHATKPRLPSNISSYLRTKRRYGWPLSVCRQSKTTQTKAILDHIFIPWGRHTLMPKYKSNGDDWQGETSTIHATMVRKLFWSTKYAVVRMRAYDGQLRNSLCFGWTIYLWSFLLSISWRHCCLQWCSLAAM